MTQQEALNILIQTANLAQAKGALTLKEAQVVLQAVELFTTVPAKEEEAPVEAPKEE